MSQNWIPPDSTGQQQPPWGGYSQQEYVHPHVQPNVPPQAWQQPPQPAPSVQPKGNAAKGCAMLGCGGLAAIGILVAFLTSQGSTPNLATGTASPPPGPAGVGAAANLAPLKLGHFPRTADGRLARTICGQWAGLRQEYVDRVVADTPYQLNQWFSSRAWSKVQNDSMTLGDDPAYNKLEASLGVGLVGDDASAAVATEIDKACKKAD